VETRESGQETPLHLTTRGHGLAFERDTAEKLIMSGANVNARNQFGMTPLHYAVSNDDMEAVTFFVENGADIHVHDSLFGSTPLHNVFGNKSASIAEYLISKVAKVDSRDKDGATPLFEATEEISRFLISKGANVNAVDHDGRTPLFSAIGVADISVVEILLVAGARVSAKCNEGSTPLHYAAERPQGQEFWAYGEIAKLLVQRGANVDARNKKGRTPPA